MKLDLEAHADASMTIRDRVDRLRVEVAAVARDCGRAEPALLAVSKRHLRASLDGAYACGLRSFGESYAQEAAEKFAGFPRDAERHFIGHVQSNKAKLIAETFDVVQSVDRLSVGTALAAAARALGKRLRVLVQINISPSERFGIAPADAPALADALRADGLDVAGTMAIGPNTADTALVRAAFESAAATHARIGGAVLSLGMSDDWRIAIASGSTMIRIGTAIFGPRPIAAKGGAAI